MVYFEHSKEACEKAQGTGIKAYPFDSEVRDLENLEEFLRENL